MLGYIDLKTGEFVSRFDAEACSSCDSGECGCKDCKKKRKQEQMKSDSISWINHSGQRVLIKLDTDQCHPPNKKCGNACFPPGKKCSVGAIASENVKNVINKYKEGMRNQKAATAEKREKYRTALSEGRANDLVPELRHNRKKIIGRQIAGAIAGATVGAAAGGGIAKAKGGNVKGSASYGASLGASIGGVIGGASGRQEVGKNRKIFKEETNKILKEKKKRDIENKKRKEFLTKIGSKHEGLKNDSLDRDEYARGYMAASGIQLREDQGYDYVMGLLDGVS